MTQIPSVADGQLQKAAAGEEAGLAVDSPAWFAWLADDANFSFSFWSPAWSTTWLPCPPPVSWSWTTTTSCAPRLCTTRSPSCSSTCHRRCIW
jgi:hypothetical protein